MEIAKVYDIIHKITEGFEANATQCLANNSTVVVDLIREQIYSGVDGKGEHLSPTYDDDPYFEEPGYWYHRAADYKAWKYKITPPETSPNLHLAPRPVAVPNLFIDGTFFGQINARMNGDVLDVMPGNGNGPAIRGKYGDDLFLLGNNAVDWFNVNFLLPSIDKFFNECGYQ